MCFLRIQVGELDAARDLAPPLCCYGRSGARVPTIYPGRESDVAPSVSDGSADVNEFIIIPLAFRSAQLATRYAYGSAAEHTVGLGWGEQP